MSKKVSAAPTVTAPEWNSVLILTHETCYLWHECRKEKRSDVPRQRPKKNKKEIIQFYQIHHASYRHLLILILSLLSSAHRSSLVLSNVCPSGVLLPSALMRTAAVARNTNCYLTLCLCFFPASHGSLGPLVFLDLHICSDKRKELVDLTKQWHR